MMFHVLGYIVLLWVCCNAQNDDCGPPPRRNNEELADLSGKQAYSHGDIVYYNCRPGYMKLGRIKVQCNNGNWVQRPPYTECRKKSCGNPGDIEFGSFELTNGDEFVFGSRVIYHCDPGYEMLSQTNYRDCRADGWSNEVPHCEVKKCFPVEPPENGRIMMTGIYGLDQDFIFGQALRFECNPKFRIVGAKEIVCGDGGQWQPDIPTCQEIICDPGNIVNGQITSLKNVYKEGDELQIECNRGYKPIDRSAAVCSENGWNTRLECTEIVCSHPTVNNGRVNPVRKQYSYEETIKIECESGYEPDQNQATSQCTRSGWNPKPKCVSKSCNYPEGENIEVYGYSRRYSYYYFPKTEGYSIDFRCKNGFLPASKNEYWERSTCTKSGWDPQPKCFKKCEHRTYFPFGQFVSFDSYTLIEGDEISFSCHIGYYPEQQKTKAICTKNGWSPTPRCIPRVIPTCKREPPLNGFFTDQKNQFALNERTKYRCHIGYTTREGLEEGETQCLREGWTPKPECVQTCQKPTEGNVIISVTKNVFLLEENLPYKCEDGYETTQKALEDNSKCTVNGWSPRPQCLPIQCEGIYLHNGTVKPRKNQYVYNDVVQFSCHAGYTRVGPISAQCYHFGWSPPPPVCKASGSISSCQPPSNITDGRIITGLQEEYQHDNQVEYECNIKYAMTGSQKIQCVDGQWTSLPSCTEEKRPCRSPPTDIHKGRKTGTPQLQYFHGETVEYECDKGFSLVGTNPAKCLHGKWDLPSCANGCERPEIPKYTNSDTLRRRYRNNEVINFSCGSSQHITRCVKGNWSPKPDCRELCAPPPQLSNATKIFEVRKFENGEKIQFTCKENFLLEGQKEISCEDGMWKNLPRCIDASCKNPPPIANGSAVNGTQGRYIPGSEVEYRCNEGFEITEKISTCSSRSWIPVPTCKEKQCGAPPQVFDASLEETEKKNYEPGEILRYMCHPGFTAVGSPEVTCRRGQWTEPPTCEDAACGDPPRVANADIIKGISGVYKPGHKVKYQCHRGFEMAESDTVTCGIKEWSKAPMCKDITCPPPNEIAHGEIAGLRKARYMPYDTVKYQCNRGRILSGPVVVTCMNGQWTNLPACLDPTSNCGRPPTIQNGDVIDSLRRSYPPGTTLRYKCQNLYLINGSAEIHCVSGQWTEPPICIEACTISEEDMSRNNIQLRWRYDSKLYARSGAAVHFSCKWNYKEDPSSPPFRTHCINGRVEYPRCVSQVNVTVTKD